MNYENEQTFVIWKHYGIPDEESNLRLVMRLLAFAYKIENLDNHGQNISIIIELSSSKGMKTIKSGWKVHPLGLITCSTPFTGR